MSGPSREFIEEFRRFARLIEVYSKLVDTNFLHSFVVFDYEHAVATRSRDLLESAATVQRLASETLDFFISDHVESQLQASISIIRAQLERWGYLFVLEADGLDRVRSLAESRERERWFPVLRMAYAWRSMPGLEPNENASNLKDEARRRGLSPAELPPETTASDAGDETARLYETWRATPTLSEIIPSVTDEEGRRLEIAADSFRQYAETLREIELTSSIPTSESPPVLALQAQSHATQPVSVRLSAVESFRHLATEFRNSSERSRQLFHKFIRGDKSRSGDFINAMNKAASSVLTMSRSTSEPINSDFEFREIDGHVFHFGESRDGDPANARRLARGHREFSRFCGLAELAVQLLVDAGRLESQERPDPKHIVAVENFWSSRLMRYVCRLAAENRKFSRLRMGPESITELPFDVFEAAALALEMTADDVSAGEIDGPQVDHKNGPVQPLKASDDKAGIPDVQSSQGVNEAFSTDNPPSPHIRRGRTPKQDKIGEALTRIISRLKERLPLSISSIARDVGCTPQNLRASERFMDGYRALGGGRQLPQGSKIEGILEAEDNFE